MFFEKEEKIVIGSVLFLFVFLVVLNSSPNYVEFIESITGNPAYEVKESSYLPPQPSPFSPLPFDIEPPQPKIEKSEQKCPKLNCPPPEPILPGGLCEYLSPNIDGQGCPKGCPELKCKTPNVYIKAWAGGEVEVVSVMPPTSTIKSGETFTAANKYVESNTKLILKARDSGYGEFNYKFAKWYSKTNTCIGTDPVCEFTVDEDEFILALFADPSGEIPTIPAGYE